MNDPHSHLSPRRLRSKQKRAQYRFSFGNSVSMQIQFILDLNLPVAQFPKDRLLQPGTHKRHAIPLVDFG